MDEKRFSPSGLVVGLAGLAVAIWGLFGSPEIADSSLLKWGAIGVAALIGVVLIVAGGVSGRKS